tara:strand:- start:74 stop:586 length:513 start_codon:yes stop_codon:yes gene_type:complete
MGKKSRNKGAAFERWVANQLKVHWPSARRRGNAQADGRRLESDVEGVPGWSIECKRYAAPPSWEQCRRWFMDIPVDGRSALLVVRSDRKQAVVYLESDRGLVCQPFADWLEIESNSIERNWCAECGEECETVYCSECARVVRCPHDEDPVDCDACYRLSDVAYDCARENR